MSYARSLRFACELQRRGNWNWELYNLNTLNLMILAFAPFWQTSFRSKAEKFIFLHSIAKSLIYLLKYFPITGIFANSFASTLPTNQVKKIKRAKPVPKEKSKEPDTHFTSARCKK